MPEILRIGEASANPGEIESGHAFSVSSDRQSKWDLHVILFNGARDGPTVVLTGGMHPIELVGTVVSQILRRKIDARILRGKIIAFPLSNPLAFRAGLNVSPEDSQDMFLSFPGNTNGTATSQLAHFIWTRATQQSDFVIDLHSNAEPALNFAVVGNAKDVHVELKALEVAKAFGVSIVRQKNQVGASSFPDYAKLCMDNDIPAFMVEIETGTTLTFDQNCIAVRIATRGVINCLKKLGMLEGPLETQTDLEIPPRNFEMFGPLLAKTTGFVNRLVKTGRRLEKNKPAADIIDIFGNILETVVMPVDGFILDWNVGAPPHYTLWVNAGEEIGYVYTTNE